MSPLKRAIVALVAFLPAALLASQAGAETLKQRLQAHLSALQKPGRAEKADSGALLHWHLSEAQRLATDVVGGAEAVAPVAGRLAKSAKWPWLQGEALGTLASLQSAADPGAARVIVAQAGVLADAWVLGPLSGPGTSADGAFAKAFDPAARTEGQHHEIGWRWVEDAAVMGGLQLADLLDTEGDAHAYVLFTVRAKRRVDAMLVLGTSGAVTAWVDGKQVVSWDGERPLTDWQHAVPLSLKAGLHRIAVAVGHRTSAPELIARLVDRNGRLPDGVEVVKGAADDVLGGWEPSKRLPKPLAELSEAPAVRGRLLVSIVPEEPQKRAAPALMEKAIEASPEDPELYYVLARTESSDPNRARMALEKAVALSKGHHVEALAALLDATQSAGLGVAADKLYRKLVAEDPAHPQALVYEASKLAALTDQVAALARLESHGALPDHAEVVWTRASLLEDAGRPLEAAKGWHHLSKLIGGRQEAVARAASLWRRAGRPGEAVAAIAEARARRPFSTGLASLEALTYAGAAVGDSKAFEKALAVLAEAREVHPDSSDLSEAEGQVRLLMGDRPGALAAFDRALELRPQNRALADYRRSLVTERSLAEQYAEKLEDVVAAAPAPAPAPEGASVLLDKTVIRVQPSGLHSKLRQRIVRVEGDSAKESLETLSFPFTPGEDTVHVVQAEVLHADGSRSRPRGVGVHRPSGKQSGVYTLTAFKVVQFETLREGDVVHVQVRHDEIGERNLFGGFFGVFLPVSESWPKQRVELLVDAPAGRKLYAHGEGIGDPERATEGDRQTLRWSLKDVPALALEPRMPGYGDVARYASVSTYESWSALAEWYRELVAPQLRLSPELVAKAQKLVEGVTGTREKAAIIQEWVVENTRYVGIEFGIHGFKPYRVTQVVERGYGDCKDKAALLVSMLGAVGVHAEFVLVRTRDLGHLASRPATLWAFNHAIAYVPELDTYVDGTSEFAGLGEVPALDQGAMVLRIDVVPGATSKPVLTTLPWRPASENLMTSKGHWTVEASGAALVESEEVIRGTASARIRRMFQDASRREQLLASLVTRQYDGAVLEKASFSDMRALSQPVRVGVRARVPKFGRRQGDVLEVPTSSDPTQLLKRYGGLAERAQPLVLDYPYEQRGESTYAFPKGSTVASLPEAQAVKSRFGSFTLNASKTAEGHVTVTERLVLSTPRIEPQDYPDFRRFLGEVARAQGEVIRVRVKGP